MTSELLSELPPTSFAFAYGSAVFRQASYAEEQFKNAMLDLILAVDDPLEWHRANIAMNRKHYSFLASFGPRVVNHVQQNWGARIYYNPYVKIGERDAKYGVMSVSHLLQDLTEWETLYVSGRMHKPILVLKHHEKVSQAAEVNRDSAVRTSLLMLPETFSHDELYETIAGLSYIGDFRMTVGENKNKVRNIVSARRPEFEKLYAPSLRRLSHVLQVNNNAMKQDTSAATVQDHVSRLPSKLRSYLPPSLPSHAHYKPAVRTALSRIVGRTSSTQSMKGILTAGVRKTVRYSIAKLKKMR